MQPRTKIIIFLALTFVLSFFAYLPIISTGTMEGQGGLYVLLLMWSPGIAALLTQFIANRSLRGLGWRPGPARCLGLAYILPVLYALPVYGVTWVTGLGIVPAQEFLTIVAGQVPIDNTTLAVIVFILVYATLGIGLSIISALGEEIGWRGFLVPELSRLNSFTRTALISGAIWAVYHLPAIFLADYAGSGVPKWYAAIFFTVMVLSISFPFTWLTLKSGSLWPAVLLHASHNLFIQGIFEPVTGDTGITAYITGEFGVGLALVGMVAAYVFWRKRGQLSGWDTHSISQGASVYQPN